MLIKTSWARSFPFPSFLCLSPSSFPSTLFLSSPDQRQMIFNEFGAERVRLVRASLVIITLYICSSLGCTVSECHPCRWPLVRPHPPRAATVVYTMNKQLWCRRVAFLRSQIVVIHVFGFWHCVCNVWLILLWLTVWLKKLDGPDKPSVCPPWLYISARRKAPALSLTRVCTVHCDQMIIYQSHYPS